MKILFLKFVTLLCFAHIVLAQERNKKVVCYYNVVRQHLGALRRDELLDALEFCTHLVYAQADITADLTIPTENMEISVSEIRMLQKKYPLIKFYLSLSSNTDRGVEDYSRNTSPRISDVQTNFIQTSIELIKLLGFDGMDLAFPFITKRKYSLRFLNKALDFLEYIILGDNIEFDFNYKKGFADFVKHLHKAYAKENLSLSLTVLPNVNSSWWFDIPEIHDKFEYINLFAFDFIRPDVNRHTADYIAPIYFMNGRDRLPKNTVDFQVQHWIDNGCPASKLNLGIPTYARTWKQNYSYLSGSYPDGPAPKGADSQIDGLLSYAEACLKVHEGDCRGNPDPQFGRSSVCLIDKEKAWP